MYSGINFLYSIMIHISRTFLMTLQHEWNDKQLFLAPERVWKSVRISLEYGNNYLHRVNYNATKETAIVYAN